MSNCVICFLAVFMVLIFISSFINKTFKRIFSFPYESKKRCLRCSQVHRKYVEKLQPRQLKEWGRGKFWNKWRKQRGHNTLSPFPPCKISRRYPSFPVDIWRSQIPCWKKHIFEFQYKAPLPLTKTSKRRERFKTNEEDGHATTLSPPPLYSHNQQDTLHSLRISEDQNRALRNTSLRFNKDNSSPLDSFPLFQID